MLHFKKVDSLICWNLHSSGDMDAQGGVEKILVICHAGQKREDLIASNNKDVTLTLKSKVMEKS